MNRFAQIRARCCRNRFPLLVRRERRWGRRAAGIPQRAANRGFALIGSLALALGALACGSGVASLAEIRDLQAQGRFEESIDSLRFLWYAERANRPCDE